MHSDADPAYLFKAYPGRGYGGKVVQETFSFFFSVAPSLGYKGASEPDGICNLHHVLGQFQGLLPDGYHWKMSTKRHYLCCQGITVHRRAPAGVTLEASFTIGPLLLKGFFTFKS